MPQDIKIWEILNKDNLKEIPKEKLDSEEKLENWIEKDIGMIADSLLIIGRQVETDFGGVIDLLCLDAVGDLVIVELKKDKTPREITAQLLDYASWVKDLSNNRIYQIAEDYLGSDRSLDQVFKEEFGEDIPDVLNESHRMIVVASEIDSSSERIIEYLSDSYGVGINAVTFQFFKEGSKKYLARVFLIELGEAEYRTRTKSISKRKPNLTYEELEGMASESGVDTIYAKALEDLMPYFDQKVTTRSSVAFIGLMGEERSRNTVFSLLPRESNTDKGLKFQVYVDRFTEYFGVDKNKTSRILPGYVKTHDFEDWGERGEGYFQNESKVDNLIKELKESKKPGK